MEELTAYDHGGVPATMEDLARFLLIAPEKATALRAEIRAIQKVGLAKAVYDQKMEEQRRLCDMILDASVRLGEMTKALPKSVGGRPEKTGDSGVPSFEESKTKEETVNELGFSKKQVQRFETLADNRDLVEREKAQAREEGRMPTRSNVLNFARERQRQLDDEKRQAAEDYQMVKAILAITKAAERLPDSHSVLTALTRQYDADERETLLTAVRDAISKLQEIERILRKEVIHRGESHHQQGSKAVRD